MVNTDSSSQTPHAQSPAESNPILRALSNVSRLPLWRQVALIFSLSASIAIAIAAVSWLNQPSMSVLYSNLAEKDLYRVLDVLHSEDVPFRIEGSGTLLVPSGKVHGLRLRLAADDLPESAVPGFEAIAGSSVPLAGQSMDPARYHRTLEVELSRSIMSLNYVQSARVHLALPRQGDSRSDNMQASASVVLKMRSGRSLSEEQIAAITHLVSSSIPQLPLDQVAVIDQRGNLLTRQQHDSELRATRSQLEYSRELENHYIERIYAILEPVVGRGSSRAQVSAELDFPAAAQAPGAAPKSKTNAAGSSGAGIAGRDSPAGQRTLLDGRISRLSVAVVIDDKIVRSGDGKVSRRAYSPEEINQLRELVREAVGYNVGRGDSVSVVNAAFNPLPEDKVELPDPGIWEVPGLRDQIIKIIGLLIIAVLMWKVLRPVLLALVTARPVSAPPMIRGAGAAISDSDDTIRVGDHEQLVERLLQAAGSQAEAVKKMARKEPGMVAQVIKTWLAEDRR